MFRIYNQEDIIDNHDDDCQTDINDSSSLKILSYKIELYKQLYYDEIERREQINSRAQWCVTLVIVIVGSFALTLSKFILDESMQIWQIIISFILSICDVICIYIMIKSLKDCFMKYSSTRINPELIHSLISQNEQCLDEYSNTDILNNIQEQIVNAYIKCAINCNQQNDEKISLISKIYKYIYVSIAITSVLFVINI